MNFRIAVAALLTTSVSVFATAHHEWPEIIPVNIEGIHVPVGYDDNDLITVVTTGTLKKSCWWQAAPEVKVDNNARTVTIKQIVHGYPSTCTDSAIPYHRQVELGMLPAGEYALVDGLTKQRIGTLPVVKAHNAVSYGPYVDEAMYAFVEDAYVNQPYGANEATLILDMKVPENCMRFKEAQVEYQPGVIVVKPLIEGEATCKGELKHYRYETVLRSEAKGAQLIHVRSLWGRSVNRLVEIRD